MVTVAKSCPTASSTNAIVTNTDMRTAANMTIALTFTSVTTILPQPWSQLGIRLGVKLAESASDLIFLHHAHKNFSKRVYIFDILIFLSIIVIEFN
jgi:hypothetical protein